MLRYAVSIVLILTAIIPFRIFQVLGNAGDLAPYPPRNVEHLLTVPGLMFQGECAREQHLGQTRDITIAWDAGEIYVATPNGVHIVNARANAPTQASPQASPQPSPMFGFDGPTQALDLAITPDGNLHLLGAGIADGKILLHAPYADADTLTLPLDIPASDDAIIAIATIDQTTAYLTVTNTPPASSLWDAALGRHVARNATLYRVTTSGDVEPIASGLRTPTSMDYDPQSGVLYIAEAGAFGISIWQGSDTQPLSQIDFAPLFNTPSWIALDPENRLWYAANPKSFAWMINAHPRPTQIGMLNINQRFADQVYLEHGGINLSGGTAAYVDPDTQTMLIFGPENSPQTHGLRCALPEIWQHSKGYEASRPQGPQGVGQIPEQ